MHYASVTCTPLSHLRGIMGLVLVLLRLNVPINNFSVMSGRSHLFLGITSTFFFWGGVNVSLLKNTARRR